jgi:hypothetical protein
VIDFQPLSPATLQSPALNHRKTHVRSGNRHHFVMPDDRVRDWSKSDRRQTVEETPPASNQLVSFAERNVEVDELRISSAKEGNADVDQTGLNLRPVECTVASHFNRL